MPTSETRDNPTASAVSEANRLVAETNRRTVDSSKAAVEAARSFLDDATEINTKLFDAWVASAEGGLKAIFELQNASAAAAFPLLDAAMTSQRTVLQQWEAAVHQGQQAVLDGFRARVRATSQFGKVVTTP